MMRSLSGCSAVVVFAGAVACAADPAPVTPLPMPNDAVKRLGTAALKVGSEVRGLAVLPDGKKVVISTADGISIWDLETGRRLANTDLPPTQTRGGDFKLPADAGLSEPVATDGKSVLLLRKGWVYRYPISLDAKPEGFWTHIGAGIAAVGYTPLTTELVGLTTKGGLVLERIDKKTFWRTAGGQSLRGERLFLVTGGEIAAHGSERGRISLRKVVFAGNQARGELEVEGLQALALSRDGKWLGTVEGGPKEWRLRLWKVDGLTPSGKWKCPATDVLALSADGTLAAGCSGLDGKVWVFNTETGKELLTLTATGDQIRHLAFLPSGDTLVAAGKAGVIHMWDARTGKRVGPTGGHLGGVRAVAYTADGGAVTASADGTAKLWDAAGKEIRTFAGHSGSVNALVLSADGKTLFTASADGTVRAWDVGKGTELRKFTPEKLVEPIRALALSTDGKTLAAGGAARGAIRLLDAATLKPAGALGETGAVALCFAGERLIARDAAHTIRVWDVATAKELRFFGIGVGTSAAAVPLAVSPDGTVVASALGAAAFDLELWDAKTGKSLARVPVGRRESVVTALAYLKGGKAIAVGDAGGVVWVIDLEKKAVRQVFKGHRGAVLSLAVSPDGKTLASGGADTTVLVWKLN